MNNVDCPATTLEIVEQPGYSVGLPAINLVNFESSSAALQSSDHIIELLLFFLDVIRLGKIHDEQNPDRIVSRPDVALFGIFEIPREDEFRCSGKEKGT